MDIASIFVTLGYVILFVSAVTYYFYLRNQYPTVLYLDRSNQPLKNKINGIKNIVFVVSFLIHKNEHEMDGTLFVFTPNAVYQLGEEFKQITMDIDNLKSYLQRKTKQGYFIRLYDSECSYYYYYSTQNKDAIQEFIEVGEVV